MKRGAGSGEQEAGSSLLPAQGSGAELELPNHSMAPKKACWGNDPGIFSENIN